MKELDALSIKNLNFEDIKNSFKQFLRQQSLFTDYNLEGSNFAILFDILAYNTYYTAMYQNFISAESWLDSSVRRSSVVSHTKPLAFLPRTKKCSKFVASISILAESEDYSSSLTIPPYTKFNGGDYFFLNMDPILLPKNESGYFASVDPVVLFEGVKINYRFIANDRNLYTIPYDSLDSSTLVVNVYDSLEYYERVKTTGDYSYVHTYSFADSIVDKNAESEIYFLQESVTGYYELYFGESILGKKPDLDAIIETIFISSSGPHANDIASVTFSATDLGVTSISGYTAITVTPINEDTTSFGGLERQPIDEIKKYAPYHFEAQDRIVSLNDYYYFISHYLGEYDKLSVWGGETNNPPRYGSVFCMLKPKGQERLSTFEKEALKTYITSKSILGLDFNIIDPNIVYIIPQIKIRYSGKLVKNTQLFYTRVNGFISNFANSAINTFRSSDMIVYLKENVPAIRSLTIRLKLRKRITPVINTVSNYTVDFNTSVEPGTLQSLANFSLDTTSLYTERFFDNGTGLVFYEKYDTVSKIKTRTKVGSINYSTGEIKLENIRIVEMMEDTTYETDLIFWMNSVDDDFLGTQKSFPVFDVNAIVKEYVNDPS